MTKTDLSSVKKETTRKKILETMQKGIVAYELVNLGWDVGQHYGDGYDLVLIRK